MAKITAFCFHPAFFPPTSGGEEREYYLYYYLSFIHEITLITFTYKNEGELPEYVQHTNTFLEIRIPKSKITDYLYFFISHNSKIVECSAVTCSLESIFNSKFRQVGKERILNSDVIIFDQPYLCTFPKGLLSGKHVIYNTYNNEYEMMKPTLGRDMLGKFLLAYVHFIEKRTIKLSNQILCVSNSDITSLSREYFADSKKFYIIPNGVSLSAYNLAFEHRKTLPHVKFGIFIGSFHPPNISAIFHIIEIADLTSDILYLIIGSAADYFLNQDGLTEYCENDSLINSELSQELTIDGIYPVELWGTIPIVWTKPRFCIFSSQEINDLTVSCFSMFNQELIIDFGSKKTIKNIVSGWNTIHVDSVGSGESLDFICSTPNSDEHRTLGVAISEVSFIISGERKKLSGDQISSTIKCIKGHKNIILLGKVSEKEKLALYQTALFAINPMTEGSGTNLKVLGYLAAGVPLITTHIGARGFPLIDETHAIICDLNTFPDRIYHLISHPELLDKLSFYGRKLVEDMYDWEKIAENFQIILKK